MSLSAKTICAGVEKYGGTKGFFKQSHPALLGVAEPLKNQMSHLMNCAWASGTWDEVRKIGNTIRKISDKYEVNLSLPWSRSSIVNFVVGLSLEGLAPATIRTYVSRSNSWHEAQGVTPLWCQSDIRLIMRGIQNRPSEARAETKRLAITPALLRVLKSKLFESSLPLGEKRMIWLTCTLLYVGSLRSVEVLSTSTYNYDPTSTLRVKDVAKKTDIVKGNTVHYLKLKLRNPKEYKGAGEVSVEILPAPAQFWCPVQAFEEYMLHAKTFPSNMPLLRTSTKLLCNKRFNDILKSLLDSEVDYGKVRTHSFRAGLTSALAKAEVSDDVIKSLGRWHSNAYRQELLRCYIVTFDIEPLYNT